MTEARIQPREYADDFLRRTWPGHRLGKASGVLFLIYMDGPGSYGGESYVSTTEYITDSADRRIEQIQDDGSYSPEKPDYAGAATEFLKDVGIMWIRGIQGTV